MSPKTPRDISGQQLITVLLKYNYKIVRQKGGHIRLTYKSEHSSHHITIPDHKPLKLGTLNSIIQDICIHLEITKDEFLTNIR